MTTINICPVVAGWTARGWYDLDELRAHMFACEQCGPIVASLAGALQPAIDAWALAEDQEDDALLEDDFPPAGPEPNIAPDIETITAWMDEDGGCEATDDAIRRAYAETGSLTRTCMLTFGYKDGYSFSQVKRALGMA